MSCEWKERAEDPVLSKSPHYQAPSVSSSLDDSNNESSSSNNNNNDDELELSSSLFISKRNFTSEQLAYYDGTVDETIPKRKVLVKESDNKKPVYLSLKGIVFDVSEATNFYGPGGPYESFAGRECGMALAKRNMYDASLLDEAVDSSLLNEKERTQLAEWIHKFQKVRCYPIMGRLVSSSQLPDPDRLLTKDDLLANDGTIHHHNNNKNDDDDNTGDDDDDDDVVIPEGYGTVPIYLGVDGTVFDVSFGGLEYYGKGCPYHPFAGKDVSRALAKMSLDVAEIDNCAVHDLNEKECKTLKDWKTSFQDKRKYPIVGQLNY
eukprot:CAMPEP_0197825522 /NCGR_PEP_ID=MMETSP1437-20131217/2580_1 /TAXON_ID=49252 ORGANISM="Eucampia antarctica, Strain CCMP1452" /NCGR_SAMPLE_ID=MMETSP1437 /ASSEMBLY_ACC=CAM_ASM_001096 /LENGTH=319 /DNA_ID=CAMNT_0043425539 /DNA_START=55 /DNA_END=1014 /DNA_ORIENTATION=+